MKKKFLALFSNSSETMENYKKLMVDYARGTLDEGVTKADADNKIREIQFNLIGLDEKNPSKRDIKKALRRHKVDLFELIEDTIIDKETVIGDNSKIGYGDDYTPNKDNAKVLSSGLNVIGKKLILPKGLQIERNVRIFSSANHKTIEQTHFASGETLK